MVGICEGAPRKQNIRLGDVVVGIDALLYDQGEVLHGGYFQRTVSLNKPLKGILAALGTSNRKNMLQQVAPPSETLPGATI
jgi:hypothetical protein